MYINSFKLFTYNLINIYKNIISIVLLIVNYLSKPSN